MAVLAVVETAERAVDDLCGALPSAIAHTLQHNPHKLSRQSAAEYLEIFLAAELVDRDQCIRTDEVWVLRWHTDLVSESTTTGHHVVVGPTLEAVLRRGRGA